MRSESSSSKAPQFWKEKGSKYSIQAMPTLGPKVNTYYLHMGYLDPWVSGINNAVSSVPCVVEEQSIGALVDSVH